MDNITFKKIESGKYWVHLDGERIGMVHKTENVWFWSNGTGLSPIWYETRGIAAGLLAHRHEMRKRREMR